MSSAIEIQDVRQSFTAGFWMKRVEVLRGISFAVNEGAVFGLLGPNGAGKTTLIHLITGIRTPTAGRVTVSGLAASSREARAKVGFLPERPYFHEHLTGEGFLGYMGTLAGMDGRKLAGRIAEVLSVVSLAESRQVELRRYSKGMLQRLGFAQAILHDPRILILDEPMSGLDPVGRREIRELIGRLAREGRTILMSSHIVTDVEAACDAVAMLSGGRLVRSGSVAELLAGVEGAAEVEVVGVDASVADALAGEFGPGERIGGGIRYSVSSAAESARLLRAVLDSGGSVRALRPVRPTLEDIFFREARP